MKNITRIFVSGSSIAAILFAQAGPAFAYGNYEPPLPTTHLRQQTSERDQHDTHPLVDLAKLRRGTPELNASGRNILMRSLARHRTGQRNYRRHVLGRARGYDYRVLNLSGDFRRSSAARSLPSALVQTGRGGAGVLGYRHGHPTSRAIRSGALNDRERGDAKVFGIYNRDRNILEEMSRGRI